MSAVRAGDTEMMRRLLIPSNAADKDASMEIKFLPQVRAEMRGLKGVLHYGAIDIGGPEVLIGVVSGESPAAYAVRMVRGRPIGVSLKRPTPAVLSRRSSSNVPIRRLFWQADARPSPSPPGPIRPDRSTRMQNSGSTVGTSTDAWTLVQTKASSWNEAAGPELLTSSLAGM